MTASKTIVGYRLRSDHAQDLTWASGMNRWHGARRTLVAKSARVWTDKAKAERALRSLRKHHSDWDWFARTAKVVRVVRRTR